LELAWSVILLELVKKRERLREGYVIIGEVVTTD
jgi:hypothetical protein